MSTLDSTRLAFLRRTNQRTKLYLSIFKPTVLGSSLIAEHAQGARQLSIALFTGTMADILPGMTALIGTAPGDDSLGRVRIKSLVLPYALNIAENSIRFPTGTYVTILKNWELWPVYPRVEAEEDDVQIWQDYDIEYTDQNTEPDPIAVMGCAVAGAFLTGGSVSLYFDWSNSYSPADGVTIASYSAIFDGGTPNTSTAATPGYVTWSTAGSYWVHLTITDSNGKTFTGRRQVVIHDPPLAPIVNFELTSLTGSWDSGGWQANLRLHRDMLRSEFGDRTFIIIWREDFNNNDQREIGPLAGREHILFTGWVDGESIHRLPRHKYVEFTALGTVPFLERLSAFPVTLEHNPTPDRWYQINRPTLNKAVRFYLRWNSTALTLADFYPCTDTKLAKYLDFDQENVARAVRALAEGTVFANFLSDQYGRMYLDVNAQMHTGTITYVLDMSDGDWREEEVFAYTPRTTVSWAELSGVFFDGTNEPEPFISQAPGEAPLEEGSRATVENLVTPEQTGLNQLVGMYLAWKNNNFPELDLPMAGNWADAFDVVPQETVRISFNGTETRRGFVFSNKQFIVRGVEHRYDYRTGNILTNLTCEARTVGVPGIAGNYPDIPPPPPPCDDCEPPPCVPCTPCDPNYPCTPPPENQWFEKVYVSTRTAGVWHTHNFSGPETSDEPTWTFISLGLPSQHVIRMIGDPYDPHHRQWVISGNVGEDVGVGQGNAIYTNYWDPAVEPEIYDWQLSATARDLADIVAREFDQSFPAFANVFIYDIHANIAKQGYIGAVIAGNFGVTQQQLYGQGFFLYSNNYGNSWRFGGRLNTIDPIPSPQIRRMEIGDCGGAGIVWVPIFTPTAPGDYSRIAFSLGGIGSFSEQSEDVPETDWFGASEADIYVDPSSPAVLYTLGGVFNNYRNLYKSIDMGNTWELVLTVDSGDALVNWHSFQPTFTNSQCGAGNSDLLRVIDAINGNLYFSREYGAVGTWIGPIDSTGAIGASPGISLIHNSKKYLYGIHRSSNPGDNIIFVAEHDYEAAVQNPLVWVKKTGNLPTNCGGVSDILQVWTEGPSG